MARSKIFIHGFVAPVRQGEEIVLSVWAHHELQGLSATPDTWRGIVRALADVGIAETVQHPKAPEEPRISQHWVHPKVAGAAAWADLQSLRYPSLIAAADAHGIHRSVFSQWVARHHGGEWATLKLRLQAARDAARNPIAKPSGRIL